MVQMWIPLTQGILDVIRVVIDFQGLGIYMGLLKFISLDCFQNEMRPPKQKSCYMSSLNKLNK